MTDKDKLADEAGAMFAIKNTHSMPVIGELEQADILVCIKPNNPDKEIVRICRDGRIFWNGREVESDAEFRSAMLDIRSAMLGGCAGIK